MESHNKGLQIVQEQDDLNRLLDMVEREVEGGVADEKTQQILFTRVEQFTGQRPSSIEEARELVAQVL
jgi:hypothetical protein